VWAIDPSVAHHCSTTSAVKPSAAGPRIGRRDRGRTGRRARKSV